MNGLDGLGGFVFDSIDIEEIQVLLTEDLDKIYGIAGSQETTNSKSGGRNDRLKSTVFAMRCRGESEAKIVNEIYQLDSLHHSPRLFMDSSEGYPADNEDQAFKNAWIFCSRNTTSGLQLDVPLLIEKSRLTQIRPPKLNDNALTGVVGDYVRTISPHSEANSAALLAQFLTCFGNVVGRKSFLQVEKDRHYGNLNVVIVGKSAKARKGTSWGQIKDVFKTVEMDWFKECVKSGLSSGEGLAWHVRDSGEDDQGVDDKRLLVIEKEFVSILKVFGRQGNTLSATLRDAWDDGCFQSLNKNTPYKATDAHISIVGHITQIELKKNLSEVEVGNGLGNRFLFVHSYRSKNLAFGGNIDSEKEAIDELNLRLKTAIGGKEKRLFMNNEARELWRHKYDQLSHEKPGIVGSLTSRAEAQIVRLALIYAMLACDDEIKLPHLNAAIAVWDYCEQTVEYLFAEKSGNTDVDKLVLALKKSGEAGLSRTQVLKEVFQKNKKAEQLDRIIKEALGLNLIREQETDSEVRYYAK